MTAAIIGLWAAVIGAVAALAIGMVKISKSIEHYDGDHEWRQREESLRLLRWACEHAILDGPAGIMGLAMLDELQDWPGLKDQDLQMVARMATVVLGEELGEGVLPSGEEGGW